MLAASGLFLVTVFGAMELPSWTFDSLDERNSWVPNAHFANVTFGNGVACRGGNRLGSLLHLLGSFVSDVTMAIRGHSNQSGPCWVG